MKKKNSIFRKDFGRRDLAVSVNIPDDESDATTGCITQDGLLLYSPVGSTDNLL